MPETIPSEITRLENLWSGDFGNDYVQRNIDARSGREPFWKQLLTDYPVQSILEIGCNVGANMYWLARHLLPSNVYGVDINENALSTLRQNVPNINAVWAPARDLPFRDNWFDLTFTTGVLIHQTPAALPLVMAEIVRCAKRYVLCAEYFAENLTEVSYREQQGALFKQDYGKLYQELFPNLTLLETGFLPKDEGGWDDVTYWLFKKP